jgi:hypothetical protein
MKAQLTPREWSSGTPQGHHCAHRPATPRAAPGQLEHDRDTKNTTQPSPLRTVLIGNVAVPLISNGAQLVSCNRVCFTVRGLT